MLSTQRPQLYILENETSGRGVYCAEDISAGSFIEVCPVICLDKKDTSTIHKTRLHDYYFVWDIDNKTSAIALGYGSMYNHSETPNADFEIVLDRREIIITAISDIPAGTEIAIDYIGAKEEGIELWFDPS